MVQTIPARDISLYELEEKFGLQLATDTNFFTEWTEIPTLTDGEQQAIARVKSNYLNLSKHRLMSEEAVKMVVLSPLLDLAGFYQFPFEIETETSVEISALSLKETLMFLLSKNVFGYLSSNLKAVNLM